MDFPDLKKALLEDTTDESHRRRTEKLMKYRPLKAIFKEFESCLGKSPHWRDHEFWFCNSLIDWLEYSKDTSVRKLQHKLKFFEQEMDPRENPRAAQVLEWEPVFPERSLGEGKPPLLGVCEGVNLYELQPTWKWTFGTLFGDGDRVHGGSPICQKYLGQMDPYLVRQALLGQDLVVSRKDLAWGERLCESMDLRGSPQLSQEKWRAAVSHLFQGKLTASYIGVVLRGALQVRPGKLGCFVRVFSCCALKAFRRQQPEILPLPLPVMSEEEKKIDRSSHSEVDTTRRGARGTGSTSNEECIAGVRQWGMDLASGVGDQQRVLLW